MGGLSDLLAKLGITDDSNGPIPHTNMSLRDSVVQKEPATMEDKAYWEAAKRDATEANARPFAGTGGSPPPPKPRMMHEALAKLGVDSDKPFFSEQPGNDGRAEAEANGAKSRARVEEMFNPHHLPYEQTTTEPLPPGWNIPMIKGATRFTKPPDRSAAKALVAKASGPNANNSGPRLGDDEPIATQNSSPPSQVAAMVTGASPRAAGGPPPPPPPDTGDDELRRAQEAAKAAEREAQYAHGMGAAADMISGGQQYNQHAGEDIRAAGQQGVKDVLARADQRRQTEDQGFQRSGEARAVGADQRTQQTFADSQEMNRPGTKTAKNYEMIFRAERGAEAAKLLGDTSGFSANDWKAALAAKPDAIQKPPGTGGSGGARGIAAYSKLLPPETANVWAASKRINQAVAEQGGWEKVPGVGLVQGKMPSWVPEELGGMDEKGKALRQEIGNLAATHLQSKGGKTITEQEDKIILGKIAANPNNATPEQLHRAMQIIERNTAGNARQGMAALRAENPALASQIYSAAGGNSPGELEAWANQPQTTPTGGSPPGKPPDGLEHRTLSSGKHAHRAPGGQWEVDD